MASISGLTSRPTPRRINGASNSSMRPVPVPTSSSDSISVPAKSATIASSTSCSGACSERMRSHSDALALKYAAAAAARCFADGRQPPPVGLENIGLGARQRRQRGAQLRARTAVDGAIEHPASFLETLQKARLAKKAQMARNARLALAENVRELADRQLGLAQQQKQPQARGVARGLQHGQKLLHSILTYKDIFISLCGG